MIQKPLITIILPFFNSEKYLKFSVNSVLKQTFKHWKLILIDDASTDDSLKICLEYKEKLKNKVTLILNKKNMGQAYCRNKGIAICKTKYLAFLDSDDFWHQNKLKMQINFMRKKKIKFSFSNYIVLSKKKKKIFLEKKINYKTFLTNSSIPTSSIILDKSIIKNIRFPNKIRICEDYYFKSKILMKHSAYNINKFLLFYQIREHSLQSNRIKALTTIFLINKRFNNLNIFQNLNSIFRISLNSIKKFGLFRD